MTDPSGNSESRGPHDPHDAALDPLECGLTDLTRPAEPGADLFAKAWDQVQAEDVPRVFVLRRWLAPMAVAATLTLVGLAVTMNTPSHRPVPSVAMGLRANPMPDAAALREELAEGKSQAEGSEAYKQEADGDSARKELADKKLAAATRDEISEQDRASGRGGSSNRQDVAPATEAEASKRDASREQASTAGEKLGKQAEQKSGSRDPAPAPGAAPAKDKALADKAPAADAKPRALKEESTTTGVPGAATPPPAPAATPAPAPIAPAESVPAAPAAKPDAPAAKLDGQIPLPGASSSQNRANSQFSGRAWHQDAGNAPQQAPGPESVGRLKSTPMAGYDADPNASDDSGRLSESAQRVHLSWASRVFVQGRWWWLGIAATILAFTLYWRRRLRAEDSEPAPDQ